MTATLTPAPPIAAVAEAPARPTRTYLVPFTVDGYCPVEAADRWEAQRKFEAMSLQQIAEHGEFWAGEAELKTKGAADG